MKVRGSVMPPEWDYTSSKVTVYHRANIVQITDDDGRIEYEYDEEQMTFEDFSNTLYSKQLAKLNSLDGMCSGAIYSGIDYADKHYSLSLVTQQNLKTAQDKITAGATSVIFAADGEEPTVHTAEQITAISNSAYEWGVVNTSYYAKLQKWIARETDTAILNAIDYGSMLPNDLMTELATLLAGAGIDLAKYSTMLGG